MTEGPQVVGAAVAELAGLVVSAQTVGRGWVGCCLLEAESGRGGLMGLSANLVAEAVGTALRWRVLKERLVKSVQMERWGG